MLLGMKENCPLLAAMMYPRIHCDGIPAMEKVGTIVPTFSIAPCHW
jgi:hypothetical protein